MPSAAPANPGSARDAGRTYIDGRRNSHILQLFHRDGWRAVDEVVKARVQPLLGQSVAAFERAPTAEAGTLETVDHGG